MASIGIQKLKAILRITRFQTPLYAFAGVVVSSWLANEVVVWPVADILYDGLMMSCVFAFGNCSNDLLDRETDSYSNSNRPLLSGSLTTGEVISLAIVLAGLTMIFGVLASCPAALFGIFGLLLVTLYNLWLKKVLFISNLIIGVWAILPVVLPAITERLWHWKVLITICALFCIIVGNEILADIPDREGDAAMGRTTMATAFGEKFAFYWGIGIVMLSFPILNIAAFFLQSPLGYIIVFWGLFFPLTTVFGLQLHQAGQDYERVHALNWIISIAFLIIVTTLATSR